MNVDSLDIENQAKPLKYNFSRFIFMLIPNAISVRKINSKLTLQKVFGSVNHHFLLSKYYYQEYLTKTILNL